jgi:hypothetical protein
MISQHEEERGMHDQRNSQAQQVLADFGFVPKDIKRHFIIIIYNLDSRKMDAETNAVPPVLDLPRA